MDAVLVLFGAVLTSFVGTTGLVRRLSLDRCLRIDFIAVRGTFGPTLIERLSRRLEIPKNMIFIGTSGDHFPHRIEQLGGVRVIL